MWVYTDGLSLGWRCVWNCGSVFQIVELQLFVCKVVMQIKVEFLPILIPVPRIKLRSLFKFRARCKLIFSEAYFGERGDVLLISSNPPFSHFSTKTKNEKRQRFFVAKAKTAIWGCPKTDAMIIYSTKFPLSHSK